jgi:hypothetical protein
MITAPAQRIGEIRIYRHAPSYRILRDEDENASRRRLLFHVEQGDYFATLATILGLIGDQLQDSIIKGNLPTSYQISTLETMRQDLIYLSNHFRIERK